VGSRTYGGKPGKEMVAFLENLESVEGVQALLYSNGILSCQLKSSFSGKFPILSFWNHQFQVLKKPLSKCARRNLSIIEISWFRRWRSFGNKKINQASGF
jgi:hypothetical protein